MWEDRTLPKLDASYSQVNKGRPEEDKRRDSQPLPPVIGTTSFGSGTTRCRKCKYLGNNSATYGRPSDEYGRLIEKNKKEDNFNVETRTRKPNLGGGEQTKRAKAKKSKSRALMIIGFPNQSSQAS